MASTVSGVQAVAGAPAPFASRGSLPAGLAIFHQRIPRDGDRLWNRFQLTLDPQVNLAQHSRPELGRIQVQRRHSQLPIAASPRLGILMESSAVYLHHSGE